MFIFLMRLCLIIVCIVLTIFCVFAVAYLFEEIKEKRKYEFNYYVEKDNERLKEKNKQLKEEIEKLKS